MKQELRQQLEQAQQLLQARQLDQAGPLLKRLQRLHPGVLEVAFLCGLYYGKRGNHGQAESAFSSVLHLSRVPPSLYFNLGLAQLRQRHFAEAIENFQRTLQLVPDDIPSLANISRALLEESRYDEALFHAEFWATLEPDLAAPQLVLGRIQQKRHDWEGAERAYRRSLDLGARPYQPQLHLAEVHAARHDFDAAIVAATAALEAKPSCPVARRDLLGYLLKRGDVAATIARCEQLEHVDSTALRSYNLLPTNDLGRAAEVHRAWGDQLATGLHHFNPMRLNPDPGRPLTIGYLSVGFRQHPIGSFTPPLLAAHDRRQVRVVVFADLPKADVQSERIRAIADQWINITGLSHDQAAAQIAATGVDILVDLDGHTGDWVALFGRRLAPVQVNYLGYCNTSGLATMDYRVTDHTVDPQGLADRYYSERLVRLDRPFFAYAPPGFDFDIGEAPVTRNGHLTFGSFSKASKINDRVIALWSQVLLAIPSSTLRLQGKLLSQPAGRRTVEQRFAAHGVAPERLKLCGWAPFDNYLVQHREVDVILDTYPWNGHADTCHALWMGVPTLTLRGQHHAGRIGAEIMQELDGEPFIANNEIDFVARAMTLDTDPQALAHQRKSWRERLLTSRLCDARELAVALEGTYRTMWKNYLASQLQPPATRSIYEPVHERTAPVNRLN